MTGEFPAQDPVMRKMFPFDDVIMLQCFELCVESAKAYTKSLIFRENLKLKSLYT